MVFATSLFEKGDYAYNDPQHDGTPPQGVAAMRAGYAAGSAGASLSQAAEQGVVYVRSN